MKLFEKMFCKHEWRGSGFSWVRCKKCDARRHDPEMCSEFNSAEMSMMVRAGHWKEEDIPTELKLRIQKGK